MDTSKLKASWYKTRWGVVFVFVSIILLSLAVIIGSLVVKELRDANDPSKVTISIDRFEVATKDNYWIGSSNPKVTIIEFGDFSCEMCGMAFPTIREVVAKYKSDVKFVFKDFPVVSDVSPLLAMAARCAGEQGLFWTMYDKLFINQGVASAEKLAEIAKQSGADEQRFAACLEKQTYLKNIQDDYSEGEALGIEGTPTWFINGYKVEGVIPLKGFEDMIERLKREPPD